MKGEIKVEELSDLLGVSGVTIRGDLSYLEQQGYLKRSFGGAIATHPALQNVLQSEPGITLPLLSLSQQLDIARRCAAIVSDNQTVFLGHGDLCRKIIPFLTNVKNLQLIVNDLNHAIIAEQFIDGDIIVAGSELLRPYSILCGRTLDKVIEKIAIDHFIVDVNIHDTEDMLIITPPILTLHYQCCIDKARNTTGIITSHSAACDPAISLGQLKKITNLMTIHAINERYQHLFFNAGFSLYNNNDECSTWINGNLS